MLRNQYGPAEHNLRICRGPADETNEDACVANSRVRAFSWALWLFKAVAIG